MKLPYDIYGRNNRQSGYDPSARLPYKEEITESAGTTTVYKVYDSSASGAIYKETITEADGVTSITRELSYGAWADRATLTYVPVNDTVEVG